MPIHMTNDIVDYMPYPPTPSLSASLPTRFDTRADDSWDIIPIPDGITILWEELTKPTPSSKRRWLDIGGGKGYYYVEVNYVKERLTAAFGPCWDFVQMCSPKIGAESSQGEVEVIVEGVLKAPGLPRKGVWAMGSHKYQPKNKMASYANTVLAAESAAIKAAARKLGIGLDVNEDPNEINVVTGQQNTIAALVDSLSSNGKKAQVEAALIELAPQAWENGQVVPYLITEDQLDPLKARLLKIANTP